MAAPSADSEGSRRERPQRKWSVYVLGDGELEGSGGEAIALGGERKGTEVDLTAEADRLAGTNFGHGPGQ